METDSVGNLISRTARVFSWRPTSGNRKPPRHCRGSRAARRSLWRHRRSRDPGRLTGGLGDVASPASGSGLRQRRGGGRPRRSPAAGRSSATSPPLSLASLGPDGITLADRLRSAGCDPSGLAAATWPTPVAATESSCISSRDRSSILRASDSASSPPSPPSVEGRSPSQVRPTTPAPPRWRPGATPWWPPPTWCWP